MIKREREDLSLFDNCIKNLRILDARGRSCGLLKAARLSAILTAGVVFPLLALWKNQIHRACR